jgi:hypothetical protein
MNSAGGRSGHRPFRILSLDGGGIRGAFAAGYLAEIERAVARPIGDYFDLLAGTSTGGIIAAGVAFRVPASKIVDFYRDRGPMIFQRRWRRPSRWPKGTKWIHRSLRTLYRIPTTVVDMPLKAVLGIDSAWAARTKYSEDALEAALLEIFQGLTLAESSNRLVIPSANVSKGQTKVFKTPHLDHLYIDREYKITNVLRATSAAPTYFSHARIDPGSAYVDGGLWANNPIMVAIVESIALSTQSKASGCAESFDLGDTWALSIGTGVGKFFANPPGAWAGLAWWHPAKLLNLISLSQSQGAQFQANYLLGRRLMRAEFDLPQGDWSLDNVKFIDVMIHRGKERAAEDIGKLREPFFTNPAIEYRPVGKSRTESGCVTPTGRPGA